MIRIQTSLAKNFENLNKERKHDKCEQRAIDGGNFQHSSGVHNFINSRNNVLSRLVSKIMARDPLQDRVKSRRDPVFIKQRFTEFIPTLKVTHFVGKRIFKTFQTIKYRQLGFE